MQNVYFEYALWCIVALSSIKMVRGQCPSSCFCLGGYVTCNGLTSLPSSFPEDTRSVSISNMNVDEIPAGIFANLFSLESIEIYDGSVGKIATGAFDSLNLLETVSLNEMKIGIIETYAFYNITNIGTLSLYMCSIAVIKSRAFSDIFAIDDIKMFMLNVTRIESFAFSNIDELLELNFYTNRIGEFEPYAFANFTNTHVLSMYLNTFGSFGCGSLEGLIKETYDQSVYSNSVVCNCNVLWLAKNQVLKKIMFSNWCQLPSENANIFWKDLTAEILGCDESQGFDCPSVDSIENQILLSDKDATRITTTPTSNNIVFSTEDGNFSHQSEQPVSSVEYKPESAATKPYSSNGSTVKKTVEGLQQTASRSSSPSTRMSVQSSLSTLLLSSLPSSSTSPLASTSESSFGPISSSSSSTPPPSSSVTSSTTKSFPPSTLSSSIITTSPTTTTAKTTQEPSPKGEKTSSAKENTEYTVTLNVSAEVTKQESRLSSSVYSTMKTLHADASLIKQAAVTSTLSPTSSVTKRQSNSQVVISNNTVELKAVNESRASNSRTDLQSVSLTSNSAMVLSFSLFSCVIFTALQIMMIASIQWLLFSHTVYQWRG